MKVFIIGGGAAGFFCAINAAMNFPNMKITILEKSHSPLSKVRISGGGRCNLTNACKSIADFVQNYPRGSKELYQAFNHFSQFNLQDWFKKFGVELRTEPDNRVFPISNSSQTIIDLFLDLAKSLKVNVLLNSKVTSVKQVNTITDMKPLSEGMETNSKMKDTPIPWIVYLNNSTELFCDKLVIASGGNSNLYEIIKGLGHNIITPVPSLFTFNTSDSRLKDLQGLSLKNISVKISGTKYSMTGDILITHTGLSGPVIIKLSSVAAIHLFNEHYNFEIMINWAGNLTKEEIETVIKKKRDEKIKVSLINSSLFHIPLRLWERIIGSAGIEMKKHISTLSNKDISKIANAIYEFRIFVNGKSPFKDEFVTCGGVDLKEINFKSMESKIHKGLYFAGEVLNIDGLTGGYNFQAAWTTGYIAAKSLA